MVYFPHPSIAGERPSYLHAYSSILKSHRRSPLASASSVNILVSPNVDSLCATRMLATLFKQDDIAYRIVPISGQNQVIDFKEKLKKNTDLHTLILINLGGSYDLSHTDWFGDFDLKVAIHVIDSTRPRGLDNLFLGGENGARVLVWDDGDAEKLIEEKKSWEIVQYNPEPETDDEGSEEGTEDEEGIGDEDEDDFSESEGSEVPLSESRSPSNKRKKGTRNGLRKRRRTNAVPGGVSVEEIKFHKQKLNKYYEHGLSYGQSASSTIYILATLLERVDNDFLWLAIMGLTYQYITSRISREDYETYHAVYYDEVSRLNPQLALNDTAHSSVSVNPDDMGVRTSEELRFMLFRHWTLYDAMFHSSYVASKLGIWKERGRQRLTGLLAKMGFSIPQTQQPYSHMDMDLKKSLINKLNDIAPEYGLVELSYPSFMRCYGFHSQPLSAADAVEGISALLDVAGGLRMEVEVEGMRNGGEWFGGGRTWEGTNSGKTATKTEVDPNIKIGDPTNALNDENLEDGATRPRGEPEWWIKNFWTAYDALSDISALKGSLSLAMSLQRAIIRQGTSIIDKQDIRTMRNHRVVVLTQGPDLPLFSHPGVLSRLALWLVDALRDRLPGTIVGTSSKKKVLPVVIACLDEAKGLYTIVGLMAALEFGQIRKNQFSMAFLNAEADTEIYAEYAGFDTNIIQIEQPDLNKFLHALCK